MAEEIFLQTDHSDGEEHEACDEEVLHLLWHAAEDKNARGRGQEKLEKSCLPAEIGIQ